MASFNFNEIKVFDDSMDDMDIIRNITSTVYQEKAFYIADIGKVMEKHQEWITKIPRVVPHFGNSSTLRFTLSILQMPQLPIALNNIATLGNVTNLYSFSNLSS